MICYIFFINYNYNYNLTKLFIAQTDFQKYFRLDKTINLESYLNLDKYDKLILHI